MAIKLVNKDSGSVALSTPVVVGGGTADLSNYYTKEEVDEAISIVASKADNNEKDIIALDDYITDNCALKEDIPDVSGFLNEEQVLALIEEHGGGGALPASEESEF